MVYMLYWRVRGVSGEILGYLIGSEGYPVRSVWHIVDSEGAG